MTLLAQNRDGYGRITKLLSQAHQSSPKGAPCIDRLSVRRAAQGCIALIGGDDGWMGNPATIKSHDVAELKEAFSGRLFIRISNHRNPIENQRRTLLVDPLKEFFFGFRWGFYGY